DIEAVAEAIAQTDGSDRSHRGGQGDRCGTSAHGVPGRRRLTAVELRVVDAGSDEGMEGVAVVEELVQQQEAGREPSGGGDDLIVVGNGPDGRGTAAFRLRERRVA